MHTSNALFCLPSLVSGETQEKLCNCHNLQHNTNKTQWGDIMSVFWYPSSNCTVDFFFLCVTRLSVLFVTYRARLHSKRIWVFQSHTEKKASMLWFKAQFYYSCSLSHILEHEFFCLGHLGSPGSKGKKIGFKFFWATLEGGIFNFLWAKKTWFFFKNFLATALKSCIKKLLWKIFFDFFCPQKV